MSDLEMNVRHPSFLLDKMGDECGPLQFVRELTKNALEAIERNPDRKGDIIWDVFEFPKNTGRGPKLCIVDTGAGMTPKEMKDNINSLSSSGGKQSRQDNYGMGAKIAVAARNPNGIIYMSWKDGAGYMQHFWRNPKTDAYGLKELGDKPGSHIVELSRRPRTEIKDHGTIVVLLGDSDEANTLLPPAGSPHTTTRWITRYLNSRFYRFPEGVNIQAREGSFETNEKGRLENEGTQRVILGQEHYLNKHSEANGKVGLTGATAHWWIVKEDKAVSDQSHIWVPNGHTAALYQGELYEMTEGRESVSRLQSFGITLGWQRAVIYVQPHMVPTITTDTARNRILIDTQPLPWADWGAEFCEKMPDQLAQLVADANIAAAKESHDDKIEERLRLTEALFANSTNGSSAPRSEGRSESAQSANGSGVKKPSGRGAMLAAFAGAKPLAVTKRTHEFRRPVVRWLSEEDGTRQKGDMVELAARYVPGSNELHINWDYALFDNVLKDVTKRHGKKVGVEQQAKSTIREWFELDLVEAVRGGMQKSRRSEQNANPYLTDEALTAVADSGVFLKIQRINTSLSVKVGKGKEPARPGNTDRATSKAPTPKR